MRRMSRHYNACASLSCPLYAPVVSSSCSARPTTRRQPHAAAGGALRQLRLLQRALQLRRLFGHVRHEHCFQGRGAGGTFPTRFQSHAFSLTRLRAPAYISLYVYVCLDVHIAARCMYALPVLVTSLGYLSARLLVALSHIPCDETSPQHATSAQRMPHANPVACATSASDALRDRTLQQPLG